MPWIYERGSQELTAAKSLKSLNLSDTRMTDAELKGLAGLTRLQELYLNNTYALTKGGVAELRQALPRCKIYGR